MLHTLLLLLTTPAQAVWPEDVVLSSMPNHDGLDVLDTALLGESYAQLIREVGTMIANKPVSPAETLGFYGWDIGVYNQFILTEAIDRDGQPSPWARAHESEISPPYHWIPTVHARKGLPLSTEVGFNAGWIGNSRTAVVGGFARVGVIEGYKPWPDISLQLGYSGYVGNDELDVGSLDLGITLGSTFPVGGIPGVNTARISPYANFTTIRVSASPNLEDEDVLADIGAVSYKGGRAATGDFEDPLVLPQVGTGLQFVASDVHTRLAITWAPATIPTISTGFGFTF